MSEVLIEHVVYLCNVDGFKGGSSMLWKSLGGGGG